MNTFKRKSLYAALAGVSALGAAGAAQAVNISPTGIGQVLIYPYYTTRNDLAGNAYNTLISVVNTGDSALSAKVRFLEGKDSREVLDFNLFLSPFDVWTAAILSSTSGGAKIITTDKSCTLPAIPVTGKDFVNYAYIGTNDDKGGATLDRTKEGYIEIIEMSVFGPPQINATAYYVLHDSTGTPNNCAAVTDSQASFDSYGAYYYGRLMGGATLVNVFSGTDYTEEPTVLQAFVGGSIYAFANSIFPTLEQVEPKNSVVFENFGVLNSFWPTGPKGSAADPVSAVLMHESVLNEFVVGGIAKAGTDWVITMPTKRSYVNVGTGSAPRLFQRNFNTTVGSCDDVYLYIFDREEQAVRNIDFSPPPPGGNALCWEANVVTFNNSFVLGAVNFTNVPTGFAAGWMDLIFAFKAAPTHQLASPFPDSLFISLSGAVFSASATYFGLPVIGFSVNSFQNGTLTSGGVNVLSNYGGNFLHKYQNDITGILGTSAPTGTASAGKGKRAQRKG